MLPMGTMCGFCGQLDFSSVFLDFSGFEKMMAAIQRRGPDSQGSFSFDGLRFGHCRLKIIDTSTKAAQPMVDSQLGLALVYNGAIYNYREVQAELKAKGYSFFSNGDTEVLLKAYHAWGSDCVYKLNGMFAFAIFERDTKKVVLGRDRLGIKPLYYWQKGSKMAFASNLQALLQTEISDKKINPQALNYYMNFHAVVPAPHTIIKGIHKLEPGCVMTIQPNGNTQTKRYWELKPRILQSDSNKISFVDALAQLEHQLDQAVCRRLVADVPVGVLLSGGLDSSLIVGLLAKHGQKQIETFSIGFESDEKLKGNEFEYSDIIAHHFKTKHHQIRIDQKNFLNELDECIQVMAEPMVSHDNIGFFLLSKEVKKHVKVVQSGQGADEVFGGYHWYPKLQDSTNFVTDYSLAFRDYSYQELKEVLNPNFYQADYSQQFLKEYNQKYPKAHSVDKALALDTSVMLVDDPVKRVDNMTMAWGLEARVPFLDHELVEWATNIPFEHKLKDGGKYLLKEYARSVIPNEVIDRPKGYFPVPALKYLKGAYLDYVKETLSPQKVKERGLFNPAYVQKLIEKPQEFLTPLGGSKLWQIALIHRWLDIQGV